jgi:hypothetical protein
VANHEEGVWGLDELLELVFACLRCGRGIQEILRKNLHVRALQAGWDTMMGDGA